MKIAYLILCHNDPVHIARLAKKIHSNKSDVFIHVDIESNIEEYKKLINEKEGIYFIKNRIKIYWGGYSAIEATMNTIKQAFNTNMYDRYVLLQGLDYPLKSNDEIENFFYENLEVEFIRGCNITISRNRQLYGKCKMYWFFDNKTLLKKVMNGFNKVIGIKTRKGLVKIDKQKAPIYWGAAQWALTHKCIEYIIEFNAKEKSFNKYFKNVFPADETYFHTIIFNSKFSKKTTFNGPEVEKNQLTEWRNLHYFEYPNSIRIFNSSDYSFLKKRSELFVRKTTTKESTELLDMIDSNY